VLVPHFTGVLLELLPNPPHLRKRRRTLLFAFLGLVQMSTAKPTDVSLYVQLKQTFLRKRQNRKKRTWLTSVAKILFMWPPKLRSKDHIRLAKSSFCIRMRSRACTSWWGKKKHQLKEVN
jgi:hypothetical protein